MKKIIRSLAIYASLAMVAVASFANVSDVKAQTPTPAPTPAAASTTCTDEVKTASYADFTKFRIPDAGKAYDAAKKYLAACPAEEGQIPTYLKKWTAQYDKDARKIKLNNFVGQGKYGDALPLAKQVLADDPEYIPAMVTLGYGGYAQGVNTKNESGYAEAITYAKKAIEYIESGKAPESWSPFKSKEDALGYLYYATGFMEQKTNPTDSLKSSIKAAQFDSDMKKNAQTYAFIANAYETEYAKQSAEYERLYKDKPKTPESSLAEANINQLVDRIIDSLARAVAVAGTDAGAQAAKTQWLERLTDLYKFRNKGSDAGLKDMIAGVMSKPLPPVPTPITTLPPEPAATTTPATSMSNTGSTTAPAPGSMPTAAPKTTTTTTPSSLTTPKTTTTVAPTTPVKAPVKPKTRNNHRRH